MSQTKEFSRLIDHMQDWIIGLPDTDEMRQPLETRLTPEEAEFLADFPFLPFTIEQLAEKYGAHIDEMIEKLDPMAKKGLIFRHESRNTIRYALNESMFMLYRSPFWAGKDTETTRKLAPLWLKYREEAFGQELARNDMPVMRVLPVSKSLRESSEVLPYNALKPMVEAQSFCAVAHCPCRQMKSYVGDACDHSLENCLHFGSMGRYMVEQGLAREISPAETLEILKAANEEGLVHAAENIEGHLGTICNCCGCCCVFLDTKKKMGLHTISASAYVARVDAESCVACGVCEERCPVQAIAVGDEGIAEVQDELCIGCGVCTPSCDTEAVDLIQREAAELPPDLPQEVERADAPLHPRNGKPGLTLSRVDGQKTLLKLAGPLGSGHLAQRLEHGRR